MISKTCSRVDRATLARFCIKENKLLDVHRWSERSRNSCFLPLAAKENKHESHRNEQSHAETPKKALAASCINGFPNCLDSVRIGSEGLLLRPRSQPL